MKVILSLPCTCIYFNRYTPEDTEKELEEMKMITEDHILRYLPKVRLGALCIEVFIALTEIGNSTSLDVIMRGLLPPHEKTQIEKLAIDEAKTKSYNFIKDLEFLVMLTKKGRSPASLINKVVSRRFLYDFHKSFSVRWF